MKARTTDTSRRARGALRWGLGTVATTALIVCAPITALATNPHGAPPGLAANGVPGQASLPPGQAKKAPSVQPAIPAIPPPAPPAAVSAPGHVKKGGFIPPGQAKKSPALQPQAPAVAPPPPQSLSGPPGQIKKGNGFVPPGQAKHGVGTFSPGQRGNSGAPPGLVKKGTTVPPGQVNNAAAAAASAAAARAVSTTANAAAARRIATQRSAAARARAAEFRRAAVALRRARAAALRRARAVALGSARAATTGFAATATLAATAGATGTAGATPASSTTTGAAAGGAGHRTAGSAAPRKPAANPGPASTVTRTVTRTVRDIAHVIPGWVKALMAALGLLLAIAAALFFAAALRNRRLRAQRAALLADVGALQAALLPIVPEHVGALAVSVAYRPAQGLAAGGDFYDVFPLDHDRVGLLVGDVSGHGRESLRSATFTRHMVRSYLEAGLSPRTALQLGGNVVDQHDREEFATIIAAVHDPTAGTFSYASAGHPPPIVTGPAAHQPLTVASSPPLGVGTPTGLRQTTVPLPPGSAVCLFTDGLFEARRGGAMIGRRRLEEIVHELGPEASASQLIDRVARESDVMRDDVAACMVRVDPNAAASGTVRVEELEVDAREVNRRRVRRFLQGCGVAPDEIDDVIRTARRRTAVDGAVLLRVRLAEDRSGVDVLSITSGAGGAAVATLSPARAVER